MIVRMSKYTFVLYHERQKEFLAALQELGLVDITTTGWEADDSERSMIATLERLRGAQSYFKEHPETETATVKPFGNGQEALEQYITASSEIENLRARMDKARKEADDLRVWGDFSPREVRLLADSGVRLRFFSAYTADFAEIEKKYGRELAIEKISDTGGQTYFVVVQTGDESEIPFDAQEHKAPAMTASEKEAQTASLEGELEKWNALMARAYASQEMMAAYADDIKDELDFSRARNSARREADDTLVIMEGWATAESSPRVDALAESYPDLVYIKGKPTPHDDTPVVLKNNKFANPFEVIGSFYSLPRYGTLDLTAFFGPFYMVFFGFCLGDAGYGLVLFLAGFFLRRMKGGAMKQIANLTLLCGGAAVVFGFLVGSFFGVPLGGLTIFASLKDKFLTPENLFTLALALGVAQIAFGLILKVVNTSIQYGFKYSLGTVGWLIVLPFVVLTIFGMLLPDAGLGVDFTKPLVYIPVIVGLVLMLLFHNPDKNPLKNVGSGLWNTYNDVTGFLGDFLSYIRLFALCLSGGTLAIVFNDLALGLSPDIPILKQVVTIIILLFGHSINLAMSALGSFVHPMRLSFVEFYKNAGFESAPREFSPLKKTKKAIDN